MTAASADPIPLEELNPPQNNNSNNNNTTTVTTTKTKKKKDLIRRTNSRYPTWAVDPITKRIMTCPVTVRASCEHTIDKSSFVAWINQGNTTCPVCFTSMTHIAATANKELGTKIEELTSLPPTEQQETLDDDDGDHHEEVSYAKAEAIPDEGTNNETDNNETDDNVPAAAAAITTAAPNARSAKLSSTLSPPTTPIRIARPVVTAKPKVGGGLFNTKLLSLSISPTSSPTGTRPARVVKTSDTIHKLQHKNTNTTTTAAAASTISPASSPVKKLNEKLNIKKLNDKLTNKLARIDLLNSISHSPTTTATATTTANTTPDTTPPDASDDNNNCDKNNDTDNNKNNNNNEGTMTKGGGGGGGGGGFTYGFKRSKTTGSSPVTPTSAAKQGIYSAMKRNFTVGSPTRSTTRNPTVTKQNIPVLNKIVL